MEAMMELYLFFRSCHVTWSRQIVMGSSQSLQTIQTWKPPHRFHPGDKENPVHISTRALARSLTWPSCTSRTKGAGSRQGKSQMDERIHFSALRKPTRLSPISYFLWDALLRTPPPLPRHKLVTRCASALAYRWAAASLSGSGRG